MLKRAILAGAGILGLIFSTTGFSATPDSLSLSGAWMCQGYDMHDGAYKDATLTLTLDAQNSDFANNYGAYHFKLAEPNGAVYLGEVAASGNTAAIYFANTSPKMSTDRGVGIAVITHDIDLNGKSQTILHKFYYEPTYQGGGNGSEICIKQNS
jgi:hypothetical protein